MMGSTSKSGDSSANYNLLNVFTEVRQQDFVYIIRSSTLRENADCNYFVTSGGVCINPRGLILSVSRGIPKDAQTIGVRSRTMTGFIEAEIFLRLDNLGILILKIKDEGDREYSFAEISRENPIKVGETVFGWVHHDEIPFSLLTGKISYPFENVSYPHLDGLMPDHLVAYQRDKFRNAVTRPHSFRTAGGLCQDKENTLFKHLHPDLPLIEVHGFFPTVRNLDGALGCPVFTSEKKFIGVILFCHGLREYLLPSSLVYRLLQKRKNMFQDGTCKTKQKMSEIENVGRPPRPLSPDKASKLVCLSFIQGQCNEGHDPNHLKSFNHSFLELDTNEFTLANLKPQDFDFFLVLDLKVDRKILEFPVLMINAKTLKLVDFFHRFVWPTGMRKEHADQYVQEHHGQFGNESIQHKTAIPFKEVIQQFEHWLANHKALEGNSQKRRLNRGAFITFVNKHLKTTIPDECIVAGMKLPLYFREWIGLKDNYANIYKGRTAKGMAPMMKHFNMKFVGNHGEFWSDHTKNVARILQRLLIDGAVLQISARTGNDGTIKYTFEKRQ